MLTHGCVSCVFRKKDIYMHKTTGICARVLGALALTVTVGCTALRIYLLQNAYRVEDGFYTDDPLHMVLRCVLVALAAIAFVMGHIYIKEEKTAFPMPENKAHKAVSAAMGCVLGGFLLYTLSKVVLPMFEMPGAADLIMALLAAIAMLYYFTGNKKGDFRAVLCIASALMLLVMVFSLYFNASVSYINHTVVLGYAAAIFMMLTVAAEANFLLGRAAYRRYLSYAPTAITLSITLSIPDLVYYCTDRTAVITDIYYDILLLALGIYHFVRLALIAVSNRKKEA